MLESGDPRGEYLERVLALVHSRSETLPHAPKRRGARTYYYLHSSTVSGLIQPYGPAEPSDPLLTDPDNPIRESAAQPTYDFLLISHRSQTPKPVLAVAGGSVALVAETIQIAARTQGFELPILSSGLYSLMAAEFYALRLAVKPEEAYIWLAKSLDPEPMGDSRRYELEGMKVSRGLRNLRPTAFGMGPVTIEAKRKDNFISVPGRRDEVATGRSFSAVESALGETFGIYQVHASATPEPSIKSGQYLPYGE